MPGQSTTLPSISLGDIFDKLGEAAERVDQVARNLDQQARSLGALMKTAAGWAIFALVLTLLFVLMNLAFSIYFSTLEGLAFIGGIIALAAAAVALLVTIVPLVYMAKLRSIGSGLSDGLSLEDLGALELISIIPKALGWTRALLITKIVGGVADIVAGSLGAADGQGAMGGIMIGKGVLFLAAGIVGLIILRWALRKVIADPRLPDIVKGVFR